MQPATCSASSDMVSCELLERQFDRVRTGADQPPSRQRAARSPNDHAQPAPQPVPDHGGADRPSDRERHMGAIRAPDRRGRYTTAGRGGTAHHHDRGGRRRHDLESNRSSRQAGATLGAASLEDGPATARAHAGAEAVRLGTTTGVWLKGTLHGDLRIWGNTRRRRRGSTSWARRDSRLTGYGVGGRSPNQAVQTTAV